MSNNIFHEIHKNFLKPRNLNISRNKLYILNLHITYFKMIYNMFMFYEFDNFSKSRKWPKFGNFVKIAHKFEKSKYFVDI